jgi:hypothetical protein
VSVGNFDLKIPTENIPSVNPLVFNEFLVVNLISNNFWNIFYYIKDNFFFLSCNLTRACNLVSITSKNN